MTNSVERLHERVLLVDDEPPILEIVEGIINESLGYECIKARSASEALALIDSAPIFLALLDIRMPGKDGFQLAREIIQTRPSIPCVFLSGYAERAEAIEALKIGIRDILDKPIDVNRTIDVVRRFADERLTRIIEEREIAAQVRVTFLDESTAILRDLDEMVMGMEDPARVADYAQLIFRRVHTIKGSSGAVEGASSITTIAHAFESALSPYRDGSKAIPSRVLDAMLRAVDTLREFMRLDDLGSAQFTRAAEIKSLLETAQTGGADRTTTTPTESTHAAPEERDEGVLVDNEKLDRFMSLAGDIVVFKNNFSVLAQNAGRAVPGLEDAEKSLQKLSDTLQSQIMDVRKVKLAAVLGKLPRIVRQTTQQLGKKVRLTVEGAKLEVDKNLASALSACLTHMVRNSCDHGIESPVKRAERGKPAEGQLHIHAELAGGFFTVTVRDDGAGIDPQRLREKAIQSGFLPESQARALSNDEAFALIFKSGFSTSASVSQVSGRGVGMDAVKSALDKVGGKVDVDSTPGRGTTFTLKMPIPRTVVIERAILAASGRMRIAVPLDCVAEVRQLAPADFVTYEGRLAVPHRGEMVLVGSLDDLLNPTRPNGWSRPTGVGSVVIMRHKGNLLGLRLDRLLDQIEAVVRPFDEAIGKIDGFKGIISIGTDNMAYVLSIEEIMLGL